MISRTLTRCGIDLVIRGTGFSIVINPMISEFPRNPPVANLTALTALNVQTRAWVGLVDTMLKSLEK